MSFARERSRPEVRDSAVPLGERSAWTISEAAQVYSLNYRGLLAAVRNGDLDTFRSPNRDGKPGRRRVSREAMERWIRSIEE